MQFSNYTIYSASAGSGKTYGLVKAYLRIILASKNPDLFRNLLAITFTNKAVFEMKNRVIEMLHKFSDEKILSEPQPMFSELCEELKVAAAELQKRSDRVLKYILHNYGAFNISTIDGFNHQLIRSFALDLHLNQFFEVQLDSKAILQQAVDNLLNQAGTDSELTKLLTDFSNDKIEEDKSWDTSFELLEVASMLTDENHFQELNSIKNKTLEDFKKLKLVLLQKKNYALKTIQQTAVDFLKLVEENGFDKSAFKGGYVYNFFHKLSENPENEPPSWDSAWQQNLEVEPLYGKTKSQNINTATLDSLQPLIVAYFKKIKNSFGMFHFVKNASKFVIPLALLNRIQNEIELIKDEENILPIWEFNGVISNEITTQPAPFIYERIGERFRHYFIDEFQDTSALQWKNFIPLILNAVQSESINKQRGSVLLVGDAKQSIYRWRGGKAEQFMDLYLNEVNPFYIEGQTVNLEDNYRSLKTIIDFNNHFFSFIASKFQSEKYKDLYLNATQNYPESKKNKHLKEGFLSIQFIDFESDSEEQENNRTDDNLSSNLTDREAKYCQAVEQTIEHANLSGANDKDICVLVRTNKEGLALATYLSSRGKNIISPDSLLLKNVISVRFLISLLKFIYNPDSNENKIQMLFDYISIKKISDPHGFITKYFNEPIQIFFEKHNFSLKKFNSHSLYEGVLLAVNSFDLARDSDAYLTHFLDLILDFKNGRKGGLSDFLTYWDDEKDKLSISSPEGLDAITIMTVHKSKGLSAAVIIYAFADSNLVDSRNETIWYPVSETDFAGFSNLLVRNNKSLLLYEDKSEHIVNQHNEQHLLDQINVLYVAMTRPESFLYVITSLPRKKTETYGSLFKEFLQEKGFWDETQLIYNFGEASFPLSKEKITPNQPSVLFNKSRNTPNYKIATKASLLWDSSLQNAIEKGNLLHQLLSKITYLTDLEKCMQEAVNEGILSNEQYEILYPFLFELIHNEKIIDYFTDKYEYFTEREFINAEGLFYRPDRVAYEKRTNTAIVIDYKTGKMEEKHKLQIENYAKNLAELGWNITGKILVYLENNQIINV